MERDDLTGKVSPYELAILASRIEPRACVSDPARAISAAKTLLVEARKACETAENADYKAAKDAYYEQAQATPVDWVTGIKRITGQRKERAREKFTRYLIANYPETAGDDLKRYKRHGFTEWDVQNYEGDFSRWKPGAKRCKGKQGRRISWEDGRLRTALVGLVPIKPKKSRKKPIDKFS